MCTPTITKAADQEQDVYDVACTGLDLVITITPAHPDEVPMAGLKFEAAVKLRGNDRAIQTRYGTSRANALDAAITAYDESTERGERDFPRVTCWEAIRTELRHQRAT